MKIGILGAGAMGSGIAQVFAMNGNYSIYLCDLTEELAEKGKKSIANFRICDIINKYLMIYFRRKRRYI